MPALRPFALAAFAASLLAGAGCASSDEYVPGKQVAPPAPPSSAPAGSPAMPQGSQPMTTPMPGR